MNLIYHLIPVEPEADVPAVEPEADVPVVEPEADVPAVEHINILILFTQSHVHLLWSLQKSPSSGVYVLYVLVETVHCVHCMFVCLFSCSDCVVISKLIMFLGTFN